MPNYWIFQATPEVFNLRDALKNDALKTFSVRAHKSKIKTGDKVIIWLTGNETGCYALADVMSEVRPMELHNRELPYIIKLDKIKMNRDAVQLKVEYNLWNNPIFKDDMPYSLVDELPVNIPGTNFKATGAQFQALLNIIQMRNAIQEPTANYKKLKTVTNHPLNQILFGPPGTGKTYEAINYAISIIEDKPLSVLAKEPRQQLLRRFEEYKNKRQISWVTFHQSFTYEDFVEGIKPQTTADQQVIYEIENGIFKAIANRATRKQVSYKDLLLRDELIEKAQFFKMSFDDTSVFEYCLENNCIAVKSGEQIDFSEAENEREIKEQFQLAKVSMDDMQVIQLLKNQMKTGDVVFISQDNRTLYAIGVVISDYYFDKNAEIIAAQFRRVEWLKMDLNVSIKDFHPQYFQSNTLALLNKNQINLAYFQKRKAGTSENHRHVLIIDEINRGNVSAIFGELITLIEEDKRKGAAEQLTAQLPYSKQTFSVPDNLYLIGTMNTADKSAETLDTALRRRFTFVEKQVNYEVLGKIGKIDVAKLLKKINTRIKVLLDTDHLIGHAYFLEVKNLEDLQLVFQHKIIPLLQEYFYGDWAKIGLILGKGFVKTSYILSSQKLFADFDGDNREDFEGRALYSITEMKSWDEAVFLGILGG